MVRLPLPLLREPRESMGLRGFSLFPRTTNRLVGISRGSVDARQPVGKNGLVVVSWGRQGCSRTAAGAPEPFRRSGGKQHHLCETDGALRRPD